MSFHGHGFTAVRLLSPHWYHQSVTAAIHLGFQPQVISSQTLLPPTGSWYCCVSLLHPLKAGDLCMLQAFGATPQCSLSALCQISQRYLRRWSPSTDTSNKSFTHQRHRPFPGAVAMSCRPTMSWPLWMSHKQSMLLIWERTSPLIWECSWFWAQNSHQFCSVSSSMSSPQSPHKHRFSFESWSHQFPITPSPD